MISITDEDVQEAIREADRKRREAGLQDCFVLVADLAREEGALLPAGTLYEVWSPHDTPAAADALLKMLQEHEQRDAN